MGISFRSVVPRTNIPVTLSPFMTWAKGHGLSGEEAGPYVSTTGDGVLNLLKYAFGMNPAAHSPGLIRYDDNGLIAPGMPVLDARDDLDGMSEYLAVFARRKDHQEANLEYRVQFSADLETWWVSPQEPELMVDGGDHEVDLVCVPYPMFMETEQGMVQPRFFQVVIRMLDEE